WGTGEREVLLAAGESGLFPPAKATPVADPAAERESETPATRQRETARDYSSHVARRDYPSAFALLSRHPALAGDSVEELLVAADVARLSNHPAEAVPYLQRIIRDHSRDERAPLAAFTLGRTLSGLGRTREAMNMFARVRSAWAKSPLAEEALLRQAEAASRLGEIGTAVRLAEEYDRVYPQGRRRSEVRRFARLE
ncbi:MAG TPA: tetratricopeptide repeat protein, partial [Polyangiaceae bacterium]